MSDQGNGGQAQEAAATTQQQGQEPAAQQDQQGQQGAPQGQEPQGHPQQFDPSSIQDPALRAVVERIVRDAQEARQEAARYRTERGTLQEQVQQFQRQQETEQERIQREAQEAAQERDALREQVRDLTIGAAFREAATAAGAFSPEGVQAMAKARGLTVETGQDGRPTNLPAILDSLRQTDAYLFRRTGAADASAGAGGDSAPPAGGGVNDLLRSGARRGRTR